MQASSPDPTKRVIAIIMVAVLVWGIYHAIGAYSLNYNPWRPVVVIVMTGLFLGGWLLLLRSRARRMR